MSMVNKQIREPFMNLLIKILKIIRNGFIGFEFAETLICFLLPDFCLLCGSFFLKLACHVLPLNLSCY